MARNRGNVSKLRKKFNRDAEVYEERSSSSGKSYDSFLKDGVEKYLPQEINALRMLPPIWSENPKELYSIIVYVHYDIGADSSAVLCPFKTFGKKCPICEEQERAQEAGEKEYAKDLRPSKRYLAYVIDRQEEDKGVLLYNMPVTVDKELSLKAVDMVSREVVNIDDVEEGYDISFKKSGKGKKGVKYEGIDIARKSTPLSTNDKQADAWLQHVYDNPLTDIVQEYSYEYLLDIFNGKGVEEEGTEISGTAEVSDNNPINLNNVGDPEALSYADILIMNEADCCDLVDKFTLFDDKAFEAMDSLPLEEFAKAIAEKMVQDNIISKPESTRRSRRPNKETSVENKRNEVRDRFNKK